MKEKIDKIIDDLINHEISKQQAKSMLLSLHNVSGSDFIFDSVCKIEPERQGIIKQPSIKKVDGVLMYDYDSCH